MRAGSFQKPRVWALAAAALLAAHFLMAVLSKRGESTTSDELVHVTGGYSYWRFNDYRLHPENGNLAQRWAALPLWLKGSRFPILEQSYWTTSDSWVMGHEFFYETGEDHFPKLMAAREMIALLSVATGALVFLWSRRLFGTAGGLVSLAFFAFCPLFLAHGAYATSDVCVGFFFLASSGAWWRLLEKPSAGRFALSALVFGLACVAKFSAVFLIPMMALAAMIHAGGARPGTRLRDFGGACLAALGHGVAAWAVIWAFYGFRYSAFNPALPAATQFIESWPDLYRATGAAGRMIHILANLHALPEAFLYGAAYVVQTSQQRGAFLNGAYSITGWRTYFLWCFVLKTTLPFLAASAWGLWAALRGRPDREGGRAPGLFALTPLLALFGVYWAVSIASHLNIGVRHLIPTYPVLFILVGSLGRWFEPPIHWPAGVLAGLLTWHVAESAIISPHYLAYFNELAGGPAGGANHLVDSSLDWGQDLPGLKGWLDTNLKPGEPLYLSYFGTGEPLYYGIQAHRMIFLNPFHNEETYEPLRPGVYCISATMLKLVYSPVRGPWTQAREDEYQFLRRFEPLFGAYENDPAARVKLVAALPPGKFVASRDRFLQLRFARLAACLAARKPDALIGYSIFVYRLSGADIRDATQGSLRDWIGLIERSATGRSGP